MPRHQARPGIGERAPWCTSWRATWTCRPLGENGIPDYAEHQPLPRHRAMGPPPGAPVSLHVPRI